MLRDRLVLGCRYPEVKKKLLTVHPLTLKTVKEALTVFEGARREPFQSDSVHHGTKVKQNKS